jgi:hypothetical protein
MLLMPNNNTFQFIPYCRKCGLDFGTPVLSHNINRPFLWSTSAMKYQAISLQIKRNLSIHTEKKKSKAILVIGRGAPRGCETSRLPHFLDSRLTDCGEVVSLTRRSPFTLQKNSWYPFLLENESTLGSLASGRIESIEKSNDLIGNQTRDLAA